MMSDGKLFSRSKAKELRAEIEQAFKKSKSNSRIKTVLKKVVANTILNNAELANLMLDVISLMKIDDLEIRKLCLHYVSSYAYLNSRDASEALPFLNRFKNDISPIMRSLAVKTLTSVPNTNFVELSFSVIEKFLLDSDVNVKKAAVFGVCRLSQHDPKRVEEFNLIESLNKLLYDENQSVVSQTLAAFDFLSENCKSISFRIKKEHATALLSNLGKTNQWGQIYIINSLMSYAPQTSYEALEIIEMVIPNLQHENASIVLNTVKVIVYLDNYVDNLSLRLPQLSNRLGSSIVSLLSKPSEIQFLVLRNVILLLLGKRDLVNFKVEMFFCQYDDPIYVKDTKLEIIYLLADESNVDLVLDELEAYATEVDVAMARKAIRAYGNLAVKLSSASQKCVSSLMELVSNGISYIVQEAMIVMKNIIRKYPGRFDPSISVLLQYYRQITEPDSKIALIWILGQYCQIIDNVTYLFEDFVSNFKDDTIEVQYATLTAVVKFYLQMPSEGESFVIRVLKWATEEVDNPDLRERGFFYWRQISSDENHIPGAAFQSNTKSVVLNSDPAINADNDNVDPAVLEELELTIGSLVSIYLKPVQSVFRYTKHKELPVTPALFVKPRNSGLNKSKSFDQAPSSNGTQVFSNYERYEDSPRSNSFEYGREYSSTGNFLRRATGNSNSSRNASSESFVSNEEQFKRPGFIKRLSRKASIIKNDR